MQHDYNLINQSGADFRADLNNALSAIATNNSGTSEPSTTFGYEWWIDEANGVLKIRNSANSAWITTGLSLTTNNTFTGDITGNAATATILATARTINGVSFNGSANISFNTDSVAEGSSNLYFTNERVDDRVDNLLVAGTGISLTYNDGSNTLTIANTNDADITGVVAGAALTGGGTSGDVTLNVAVDGSSIEINSDALRVKASGITNAMLAGSIANSKLSNSSVTINSQSLALGGSLDLDTSEIPENTNLYFTTERTQDVVGGMVTGNTESGITVTYDDADGTLDFVVQTLNQDTTGNAATATILETARTISGISFNGSADITLNTSTITENTNLYYTQARFDSAFTAKSTTTLSEGSNLYFTNERVDDRVSALIQDGTGISFSYNDGENTLTPTITLSPFNTSNLSESGNLYFTDARANSAIDARVTNTFINNLTGVVADTATALATARTIALAGDVVGSVSFDGTSNVSITTAIQADSVALGTDTTGDYVQTITGTANKITVSGSGTESRDVTLTLPADVQVANDLTVAGNLVVNGTLVSLDSTNLDITDNLFQLNAGLTGSPVNDTGMLINRGNQDNGIFMWDESADKFTLGLTTADGSATGNITLSALGTLVANIDGAVTGTVSSLSNHDTADLAEGTNLYYTQARFNSALTAKSTSDLSEGSNLYYTEARVTANSSVAANTAKVGITTSQASAITANTAKITYPSADSSKLAGIEAQADVTDVANVTAAGALMDSELTSIASVKALNQGVATGDSPTFVAVTGTLATAAQPNITSVGTLSALTVGGVLTANAGSSAFNNDVAGEVVATFNGTYSGSGDVQLAKFQRNGGAVATAVTYADATTDMEFGTTTGHSLSLTTGDTRRLTLDLSGNATLTNNLTANRIILADGIQDTGQAGSATVFNESGSTADFRVESDTNAHMLFVDGGNNKVGIGTASPAEALTVNGNIGISDGKIYNGAGSNSAGVSLPNSTVRIDGYNGITFHSSSTTVGSQTERARITSAGAVEIKGSSTTTNAQAFITNDNSVLTIGSSVSGSVVKDISFNSPSTMMYIDGSSGNVGIGETNPDASLHITSNTPVISFDESDAGQEYRIGSFGGAFALYDSTDSAYRLIVDGSGRVLVGITGASGYGQLETTTFTTTGQCILARTGGNVYIGNAGGFADVAGDDLVIGNNSGSHGLTIHSAAANTSSIFFGNDGTNGNIDGSVQYFHESFGTVALRRSLVFKTAGDNTRMVINSSGSLLINTTNASPANIGKHFLIVERDTSCVGGVAFGQFEGSDVASRRQVSFYNANGNVGNITTNGSSTSFNTSSDYRLKENVDYDFTALDRVAQLKPARFNFIADEDTTVDGFMAHEVQDIVPEAVAGKKDAVREEEYEVAPAVLDDDENIVTEAEMGIREVPEYQGIDQSKLVPLLTKAIQEQQALIETLTARVEQLEN